MREKVVARTQLIFQFQLSEQLSAFLLDRRAGGLTKKTLKFYEERITRFIEYCAGLGIERIDELTPEILRNFLLWLEERGNNPGGVHAGYRAIKVFLRWWENEYEPEGWKNPIRKVKAPKRSEEPLDPVPVEDVHKLMGTCKRDWLGDRDKAILRLLLDTGVRASELVAINLGDLDVMKGTLQVRQGKGRKPRPVFFGKDSRKYLRRWLNRRGPSGDALFITEVGDRLTYWGLRNIILRRSEQAEIETPTLHDFRRAFTLSQLQAGVPETAIAHMLGHTTTQLIARYAKQTPGDLQALYRVPDDESE